MDTTHLSVSALLLREFLTWYYVERPRTIVKRMLAYSRAFLQIFSISFLLRTMFSPWKAIADAYPTKGFNLNEILQSFALNMTSRMIGAVIRLVTIVIGIFVQAGCIVAGIAYLLIWIGFPFIVIAGLILLPLGA